MDIYIRLADSTHVESPSVLRPKSLYAYKRGTDALVNVRFLDEDGVVTELGDDSETGKMMIKPLKDDGTRGKYDSATPYVSVPSWTKSGSGTSTVYIFQPDFSNTTLNTALAHDDGDDTNDIEYIDGMQEISWTVSSAVSKSDVVTGRIYNDVIKGIEGVPTSAPIVAPLGFGLTPFDSYTGGSNPLDEYATVSIPVNTIVFALDSTGELSIVELESSTDATVTDSKQRPQDYAASTNEKVWFRRL